MKNKLLKTLAALMLIPLILAGQDTTDDVYDLPAFEVEANRDRGYVASNAISAYRINLPIQDIPIQIKVVTREFLDDLKAINLEEALGYSVGVSRDVAEREDGRFSIRGLQAAFPKRNGYRRYYMADMTNVERVEVIKGPASALFGEAQPGGIINYVTKRPLPEPQYRLTGTYGSYDYRRAMIEATGPLTDDRQLLYRVDASYLDRNDYRDFSFEKRTVMAPVLEWRPFARTRLKFDIEYIHRDFLPPSLAPIYNKAASDFWAALPTEPVNIKQFAVDQEVRADPASLGPFIATWRVLIPEELIPADLNELYYYRDLQTMIPREWSSTGPDAWDKFESYSYTLEGSHEFGNETSVRFAASYATIDTGYLRARPNRTRIWGDGFYRGQRLLDANNEVTNLQLDYLIPVEWSWSRHTIVVGAEYFGDAFKMVQFQNPGPGKQYFLQMYFDDSPIPSSRLNSGLYGVQEYPLEIQQIESEFVSSPSRQERETVSFYISDQMSLLNERLKVLAGLRFDRLEQDLYNYYTSDELIRSDPPVEQWSPQIGVNYELIEGLAAYANYSKSFAPGLGSFQRLNEDGSITSDIRPPELGEGHEFGLKASLMDGRLSGTIAYFDITKSNVAINLRTPGGIEYDALVEDSSTGFEVDIAYEPIVGFQILLGYAYIDSFRNDPSAPEWVQNIESRVPGVPEHQASLWAKYKFTTGGLEGLAIGGGVQWMDDFRGSQALPDVLLLDGYTKVDLLLSYALPWAGGDWTFDLFVDNVFDENFYYAGPVPANPRNYKFTVRYTF